MADKGQAGLPITRSKEADQKLAEARNDPEAYFGRVRAALAAATGRGERSTARRTQTSRPR